MPSKYRLITLALLLSAIIALLALTLGRQRTDIAYGVNLLSNPDFEHISGEGLPEGWTADAYIRAEGISEFGLAPGRAGNAARIRNHEANDARFAQSVAVSPDTLYHLHGFVRADAQGGRGANLSIGNVYVFSRSLYSAFGDWEELSLYGRTGKKQTSVTVFARLGGYGGEAAGEALFDGLSLCAVEAVPEGFSAQLWEPAESVAGNDADSAGILPAPAWPWLLLVAAVYTLVAVALAKALERAERGSPRLLEEKGHDWGLLVLLLAAWVSRMALAAVVPGYGVDIGCFTAWADRMAAAGPAHFYTADFYSDYPPGYMLVLWPIGLIGRLAGTGATEWMVKQPSILCDLAAIGVLYSYASKSMKKRGALLLCAIYAFNPLTYAAGAAWGQADSVPALLMLLVALHAAGGRWSAALPLYVTAVLMKPQALMFGPLGLLAAVTDLSWNRGKGRLRSLLIGLAVSAAVAAAVILPFSLRSEGLGWILSLYSGTMTYYSHATVNATNLYFLFGKNWGPPGEDASVLMKITGVLTWLVPFVLLALKTSLRSGGLGPQAPKKGKASFPAVFAGALLCVLLFALVPISVSGFGTIMMASSFAVAACLFVAGRDPKNLPLIGAVMLTAFFVSGVMMHERYAFAAIPLLMLSYAEKRDKRLLFLILALSALAFLNVSVVLDRGIRIGGVEGHLSAPGFGIQSDSAALEYILSGFSVLVAGFAFHTAGELVLKGSRLLPLSAASAADPQGEPAQAIPERGLLCPYIEKKADRTDAALMIGITALYAAVALTNLGSLKAPQRPWTSRNGEMQVQADLGEERSFRLLYYGGIHWRDSDFVIETSSDMETWVAFPAQMLQGDCFSWKYHTESYEGAEGTAFTSEAVVHRARYLRVKAGSIGLTLMEMLLRDAGTNETIVPEVSAGPGQALFDEQDTLDGDPGWFNGMYFDEIYHARTAYEQLNAIRGREPDDIYETSHPPLGKLMMTLSIMAFGMTPFGWRFAGALAGVLMLPSMYLLGRLLTRRRASAVVPALLMAFDCMHFAQTRIATIDSFATLFIIWSFYFMFRYVLTDGYAHPLRGSLLLLGSSGLCMGLAIACKWTGCYAGAGLAVIFFWSLFRRMKDGELAERLVQEDLPEKYLGRRDAIQCAAKSWKRRATVTLLWCLLFFVLIPAAVYLASFIPVFLRTPGGWTANKVLEASRGMLAYHSVKGLGMDHFFYSPWYEWPLSLRPMWFYSGARSGSTASTILTFGNPAVWWGGLAALLWTVAVFIRGHVRRVPLGIVLKARANDLRPAMLLVMFFAQYLPWVLVPRGTYIYHYFPAVPVIILCAALLLDRLAERSPRKAHVAEWSFVALAALLFVAFFPYCSGVRTPTAWLEAMKWFPNWLYY